MARTKINLSTQVEDQLSPANVAQDASNRLVTDAEKSGWSAKADTDNATQSTAGLMSSTDKAKLDGVENSANNYSHPANHSLDIITETSSKKIMTDNLTIRNSACVNISITRHKTIIVTDSTPEIIPQIIHEFL